MSTYPMQPPQTEPTPEQRRRIRRTAILLVFVALAIYVVFIASGVYRAQHP